MPEKNPYYKLMHVGDPVYLYRFRKETGRCSRETYYVKDLALALCKVADSDNDPGPSGSVFHAETIGGRRLADGAYFDSYRFGKVTEYEDYYSVCLSEDNLTLAYELVKTHIMDSMKKLVSEYDRQMRILGNLCSSMSKHISPIFAKIATSSMREMV